ATAGAQVVLDGSARMRQRPIKVLVEALRACGAKIEYCGEEGFPPLKIEGKNLKAPHDFHIDSNISSQYISALLMIAPCMQGGMTLHLDGECRSLPYIDMTIALMRHFGADAERNGTKIRVAPGKYIKTKYAVESDWSAASYWYEIAALRTGSKFVLRRLHARSLQGDSRVADIFRLFGVNTTYSESGITIESDGNRADRIDIDMNEQPDLAQTVVVTAAMLGIPFRITGLSTLRIKETDRITALQRELAKIGITIEAEGDDCLLYDGKTDSHRRT
ncbi:MAG: 3-phosphoshikimate 1-carboxyvinyltransferase, partial [Muribaculaceae bacterium]|nr:3-phosphoshikimate 1-carboxyvinyltransferase [Muribaculaceae bacterium]